MATSMQADVVEVLECGCKIKQASNSSIIDILLCPTHLGCLAAGRDIHLVCGGKKRDLRLGSHPDKEAHAT